MIPPRPTRRPSYSLGICYTYNTLLDRLYGEEPTCMRVICARFAEQTDRVHIGAIRGMLGRKRTVADVASGATWIGAFAPLHTITARGNLSEFCHFLSFPSPHESLSGERPKNFRVGSRKPECRRARDAATLQFPLNPD